MPSEWNESPACRALRRLAASSVRTRLILAIVLTISPLLVLVWHGARRQIERESYALEQQVQRLTAFITGDINHLLEATQQLLVAVTGIYTGTSPELGSAVLADVAREFPYCLNIGVMSPDGETFRVALSAGVSWELVDDRLLRRAAESGTLVVGEFRARASDGRSVLTAAYCPPWESGGARRPVAFVVLDLAWLDRVLTEERVTGRGALFPHNVTLNVVDRSGTILRRIPENRRWMGEKFPDSAVLDEVLRRGQGTLELRGMDGVPRLYAFQLVRAAGGGIIVCTGVSREAALAEVRAEVSRTFAAVLTVGLALILIAWFGAGLFIARPMGRLVVAAQRLANGDLSARTDAGRGPREIARLANAFNRMAAALQHEAAEREKLLARVVENDRQLRSLAAEAALSEERERHAIATGLHDKAGPLLATCYMKLGRLLRDPLPEEAAAAIGDCRTLIDHAIQEVRTLTFDLSSPALYTLGLPAALQQLCADMAESHEMDILFQDEGVPADLAEDRGVVLYRAARELLFNVAKHAAARRVELACGQKDGMIFVRVADDGVGFDATDAGRGFSRSGGFGLFKLRERLAHMGGRLTVDSARGAGARIVVALPPRETDGRGGDGHDHPDSAG